MDILFGRGNPTGQIGEGPGQSHGAISSTQRQLLRGQGTIDQFHRLERGVRMQPRAGCLSITCPPELLEPIFGGVSCTNHACTNCGAGFAERFMMYGDAGGRAALSSEYLLGQVPGPINGRNTSCDLFPDTCSARQCRNNIRMGKDLPP